MTRGAQLIQLFGMGVSLAALLAACSGIPSATPSATADVSTTVSAQVQATLAVAQASVRTQTSAPPTITPTAPSEATQSPTATATSAPRSEAAVAELARTSLARIARGSSVGSGVIASSDGLIVTNEHVIHEPGSIRVRLPDGRDAFADLLVADREVDLALLRVPLSGLQPVHFADTSHLHAGDALVVAGFALDLPGEPTITRGVFSGRRLLPDAPIEYLQTDAAMNPGVPSSISS